MLPDTSYPWAWHKALHEIVLGEPWEEPLVGQVLPVQLLPWLWLSDQESLERNAAQLRRRGITHVLSTNAMEPNEFDEFRSTLHRFGIHHHAVHGHDEEWYDMLSNHWEECEEFLRLVKATGGRVVIHCSAGINRSGLIACAAIMVLERRRLLDVVRLVKQKRYTLLMNPSFQRQLCLLAAREGLLGPPPDGFSNDPPPPRKPIDFYKYY